MGSVTWLAQVGGDETETVSGLAVYHSSGSVEVEVYIHERGGQVTNSSALWYDASSNLYVETSWCDVIRDRVLWCGRVGSGAVGMTH